MTRKIGREKGKDGREILIVTKEEGRNEGTLFHSAPYILCFSVLFLFF